MIALTRSPEEISDVIRELPEGSHVLPFAGGTKPALSATTRDDVELLDVSELRGIVEYDPAELTLTALAATPVSEIAQTLAEHDQYLPFDPPFAGAGATIGGVIASGVSGAGALRHGGIRDFVIGVQARRRHGPDRRRRRAGRQECRRVRSPEADGRVDRPPRRDHTGLRQGVPTTAGDDHG